MLGCRIFLSCATLVTLCASATTLAAKDAPLADAVERREKAAVAELLKQRVDVNALQPDGATALHWASHWDDLDLAARLLRAGANVNAANDLRVTPLMLACENRSVAMVQQLLKAGADPN